MERLTYRQDEITREIAAPSLWEDPVRARALTQELADISATLAPLHELARDLKDASELLSLAAEEDRSLLEQLAQELAGSTNLLANLETQVRFCDEADRLPAQVTVTAGSGGTEAQDFARMLYRMYVKWAGVNGFSL